MGALSKLNIKCESVSADGRRAWRLSQHVGGEGLSLVIAAGDNPDLISLGSPAEGTITFSRWNSAQKFLRPPADKIYRP